MTIEIIKNPVGVSEDLGVDGMKERILFLAAHFISLYATRRELIEYLIDRGYDIYISIPESADNKFFIEQGCKIITTKINRRGTNPFRDIFVILRYRRIIKKIKPDIVFSYEVKPNIYGGIALKGLKIPQIANITGLGTAVQNGGILKRFIIHLYRFGFRDTYKVFFQNKSNLSLFVDNGIVKDNYELIPGSGVNLKQHCFEEYPPDDDKTEFIVIGRVMKDKGIDEILEAADYIHNKYHNVNIKLIGFYDDDDYKSKIEEAMSKGIVEYCGNQTDVHSFIKNSHATIHASYHEGMANGLLETAATGRPIIATNIPGCIETFEPNVSGIAFEPRNAKDLIRAIEEFLSLPYEKKVAMGKAGRKRMEEMFDRDFVIDKYYNEIKNIEYRESKNVSVALQQAN